MAVANSDTLSQLQGLFKEIYADNIVNLIPDNAKLVKAIKYAKSDKLGNLYHQPVILTNEHGITYAAAGDGAFSLNSPVAMSTQDAQINSYQMVSRHVIPYETAARALGKDKAAFFDATELIVKNSMESMTNRLEQQLLYGQAALAQTATTSGSSGWTTGATSLLITISDASWAVGLWAGAENGALNFYKSTDNTVLNSSALVSVASVDVANKQITISGAAADISAINTWCATSGQLANIYWYSATSGTAGTFAHKTMVGLDRMCTVSGTLWNISNSTYNLWKANSYSVGGNLTFDKVNKGLNASIGKGLREDVTIYCAPQVWEYLWNELDAKRHYDYNYKGEQILGNDDFQVLTQSGKIKVVPHNCVKAGEAFVVPMNRVKRLGPSEITMVNPGMGGKMVTELENSAGFQFKLYVDQGFFCETPAWVTKLTGITY